MTTIVATTAGPFVCRWALNRYMRSTGGNYYYVYELASGAAPTQTAADVATAGVTSTLGAAVSAVSSVATNTAKAAFYATSAAVATVVATGSLLIFTVSASGAVAYKVVESSASQAFNLMSFIQTKEKMSCNLDDLDDWELVEVDLDLEQKNIGVLAYDEDEQLQSLLSSWCSMERASADVDHCLLSDQQDLTSSLSFVSQSSFKNKMRLLEANGVKEDDFEHLGDIDDEWQVVADDYLFTYDVAGSSRSPRALVLAVDDLTTYLPHLEPEALARAAADLRIYPTACESSAASTEGVAHGGSNSESTHQGNEEEGEGFLSSVAEEDEGDDLL